jgi:hypothetical protein
MCANLRLTFALVVGILALTCGTANAQIVSFSSMGYTPGQPPRSDTIAPSGTYSPPDYPNKDGGHFRVRIDYGIITGGAYIAYQPNTPGIPNPENGGTKQLPMGGGTHGWAIPIKNCSFPAHSQCLAQLQRSTDGGTTWATVATSYHSAP